MTTQHTQGRIRYEHGPGYCGELLAENGTSLCAFIDEPSEANARRLVAAWNACEGISTEALETEGSAAMGWTRAASKLIHATTQRDELLALLAEVSQSFTRDDDLPNDLLPRIDAAIAKAEGGAT